MNDKDVACLLSKQEEETTIRSAGYPPPTPPTPPCILSAEKWNIDHTAMWNFTNNSQNYTPAFFQKETSGEVF